MSEKVVVLAQPHRRGDDDVRRVSAIGRFCQRMKCRTELHDSANDYANVRKWWGAAMGKPRGFENASPRPGNGDGPSDATVRGWLATYVGIDTMIQKMPNGSTRYNQFHKVVVDDMDQPANEADDVMLTTTLRAVAIHMGRMSGRDSAFG